LTKHNSGYKGDDSRAQGYDNTRDRKIATLRCGYKADIGIRRLAAQMGADARRDFDRLPAAACRDDRLALTGNS
jgi:hypothetical protein